MMSLHAALSRPSRASRLYGSAASPRRSGSPPAGSHHAQARPDRLSSSTPARPRSRGDVSHALERDVLDLGDEHQRAPEVVEASARSSTVKTAGAQVREIHGASPRPGARERPPRAAAQAVAHVRTVAGGSERRPPARNRSRPAARRERRCTNPAGNDDGSGRSARAAVPAPSARGPSRSSSAGAARHLTAERGLLRLSQPRRRDRLPLPVDHLGVAVTRPARGLRSIASTSSRVREVTQTSSRRAT